MSAHTALLVHVKGAHLICWEAWVDLFSLCQPELFVCGRRKEEAAESCRLYVPAVVVQQQGCRSSCEQEELVMS